MKSITGEVIETVLCEFDAYSESQMHQEANRFLRQQPHLTQFIYEFTEGFRPQAQQLSLYLSYFLWKVCIRAWGSKLPRVTWQAFYHAFIKERKAWEGTSKTPKKSSHPVLITYLKTFLENDHKEVLTGDLEKGTLLILLITAVSAFEKAAETEARA